MDNYFTNIKLFKYLHKRKFEVCETVCKNSANFSQIFKVDKKLDWDNSHLA